VEQRGKENVWFTEKGVLTYVAMAQINPPKRNPAKK